MLKKILPLLLLATILHSNKTIATPTLSPSFKTIQSGKAANAGGTYVGTLPCADCAGIRMELTLTAGKAGKRNTYLLKQTYRGKSGNNTMESRGKWFAATGNSQNPKAVIYQLIPDKAYEPLYFLRVNEQQLKLLDRNQNEIKSKANYTLKRQR